MPDWLLQVVSYSMIAGAIYGGIRADIRLLHESVADAKASAMRAHDRIDSLMGGHHGKA